MPLNSPGGSTLQWGMGRGLLWLAVLALYSLLFAQGESLTGMT